MGAILGGGKKLCGSCEECYAWGQIFFLLSDLFPMP